MIPGLFMLWLWIVAMPAFWEHTMRVRPDAPLWAHLFTVMAWPMLMTVYCAFWVLGALGVRWARSITSDY